MAITKTELLEGCRRRRLRDRTAKLAVTAGGVAVLCALVLIFIFLLYVTLPLFRAPDVSVAKSFSPPVSMRSMPSVWMTTATWVTHLPEPVNWLISK